MNTALTEVLRELSLQPGERRFVTVDGEQFEIRRAAISVVDEGPMVDLIFDPGPSRAAQTLIAKLGPRQLPDPIEFTEANLVPE